MSKSYNGGSQLHTFMRGMNLDLDVSLMQDGMYSHATNIRLTPDGTATGGIINAVRGFYDISGGITKYTYIEDGVMKTKDLNDSETILGVSKIRDFGVMFTKDLSDMISIYRLIFNPKGTYSMHRVCYLEIDIDCSIGEHMSIVTYWEDASNVKVYWADGKNNLRFVNISPDKDSDNSRISSNAVDNTVGSNLKNPSFVSYTSGDIKCGMVQYAYQLFNINGAETKLSSPTEMILFTDSSETSLNYQGNSSERSSGKSAIIKFEVADSSVTHCRIYRINYHDGTKLPTVDIASEFEVATRLENGKQYQYFTDTGSIIGEITFEELITIEPYKFIPGVIEAKDNILFAGKIKEDSRVNISFDYDARAFRFNPSGEALLKSETTDDIIITKDTFDGDYLSIIPETHDALSPINTDRDSEYRYTLSESDTPIVGGYGKNVSYKMITTKFGLDYREPYRRMSRIDFNRRIKGDLYNKSSSGYKIGRNVNLKDNNLGFNYGTPSTLDDRYDTSEYVKDVNNLKNNGDRNYSNPLLASKYKSYQRDEIYRFGLVLYSETGDKSNVKWIADIRMPRMTEEAWRLFDQNERIINADKDSEVYQIVCYPLGIEFEINNLPDGVAKVELVRCERTRLDRTILSQGLISCVSDASGPISREGLQTPNQFPMYSSGNDYPLVFQYRDMFTDEVVNKSYTKYFNPSTNLLTFISPEISYFGKELSDFYKRLNRIDVVSAIYSIAKPEGRILDFAPIYKTHYPCISNSFDKYYAPNAKEYEWANGLITDSGFQESGNNVYASEVYKYYTPMSEITTIQEDESFKKVHISDIKEHPVSNTVFSESIGYENRPEVIAKAFTTPISTLTYQNWAWLLGGNVLQSKDSDIEAFKNGPHAECLVLNYDGFHKELPRINRVGGSGEYALSSYFGVTQKDPIPTMIESRNGYAESYTATYLVNIKSNNIPYSGLGYSSRVASTYISTGFFIDVYKNSASAPVFGGDTFIGLAEIITRHAFFDRNRPTVETDNSTPEERKRYRGRCGQTTVIFPCESSINLELPHGSLLTRTSGFPTSLELKAGTRPNGESQEKNLYSYNSAYSHEQTSVKHLPKAMYQKDNKVFDFRVMYSEVKTNDELSDSWLKFKPMNYRDLDTRFGELTNIKLFNDRLMFWQKDAFGELPVNQRALLSTEEFSGLLLGTGDVLGPPRYVSVSNGLKTRSFESVAVGSRGLYWFDYDRNEFLRYGDGLSSLSKEKGVQSFLIENRDAISSDVRLHYNKRYGEIYAVLNSGNKKTNLVFNEMLDVYQSFFTNQTDWSMSFGDDLYSISERKFYKFDSSPYLNMFEDGEYDQSTITYLTNKDYHSTKVFSTLSLYKEIDGGDLLFNFNTKNSGDSSTRIQDVREENSLISIPRGLSEKSYSDILPTVSQRLKGKYLYTTMVYSPNGAKEFKIPYLITSFRYSNI